MYDWIIWYIFFPWRSVMPPFIFISFCFLLYPSVPMFFACLSRTIFLWRNIAAFIKTLFCCQSFSAVNQNWWFIHDVLTLLLHQHLPCYQTYRPIPPLFHSFVLWCQRKAQAAAKLDKGLKSRFSHVRELILEEQSQAKKKKKKQNRYDKFRSICKIK